jgi:tetratricopeptide (TPR) repeat protein
MVQNKTQGSFIRSAVEGPVRIAVFIALLVGGFYFSACSKSQPAADVSYEEAQQMLEQGEYAAAAEALARIFAEDQTDAEAAFALGLAYFNAGQYEKAREAFENSLEVDPGRAAAVHHNLGALAYQVGEMQTAVEEFQAALAEDPNDPDTHYQLGATYLTMAQPTAQDQQPDEALLEKARQELERALELAPNKPEALVGLGNYYMVMNQFSEAIETLELAVEKNPQMREALFALGRAYAVNGQIERAKETLNAFLDTDPPDVWASQAREILAQLGE